MEVTSANRRQCLDQIIAKSSAAKAEPLSRLLGAVSGKKDTKEKEAPKADKAPKDDKKKKGRRKGDDSDEDEVVAAAPETLDAIYHAAAEHCEIFCRKIDKK